MPVSACRRCEIGAEQFSHGLLLRGGFDEVLATGIRDQPVERSFLEIEMVTVAAHAVTTKHEFLHQLHACTDSRVVKNDGVIDRGSFADVAAGTNH